jgi:hypothetical protein
METNPGPTKVLSVYDEADINAWQGVWRNTGKEIVSRTMNIVL